MAWQAYRQLQDGMVWNYSGRATRAIDEYMAMLRVSRVPENTKATR